MVVNVNIFLFKFLINSSLNEMSVIVGGFSKGKMTGCKLASLIAFFRSQT